MVPGAKERPVQEFLNVLVFRPLAHLVVLLLYRTRVRPHHLVLFHTALTLLAAWLLALGHDLPAALLLQLKTTLDNADGQLARLRGEASEMGRYLDTELDVLGNGFLFWALGARTGAWGLALLAFLVFTLVQSYDFNLERLYKEARGFPPGSGPRDPESRLLRLLRGIYRLLFLPQDRGITALERFLQTRFRLDPFRFWDEGALVGVVNLGLSTQLFFLGVFLVFHQPGAYLTFVLLQGLYLGLWYVWRIVRAIPSPR
ncbi:CDP-alcohol phosphatidyltransferase family protein [Thermus thermamylovorans]|uniref:CDP-alcohol phosphatidyltransferase n=1 Tax=Thermus thermamylovorans TaxID=2509362 RepID=A0A4Q9B6M5_9DEIN|nr:CDP-alcohol phosphatidyltransferase family protein [Thermus thermamylovorans]TBH20160.1 CDP-alcohol phosphatidyltransferase [Thermus thermamylovorans]